LFVRDNASPELYDDTLRSEQLLCPLVLEMFIQFSHG